MNPLTNMKNVQKLSEQELSTGNKTSWHDQYRDSAWIFVGGLPFDLTEGDIICIFSQYGEVVNINLIRGKDTGKSKGYCFLCYEDQRSTILAVDNFNGIKILNRTIRVDHVNDYKVPKEHKNTDEETKKLYSEGCAPVPKPIVAPKLKTTFDDFRETIADQIEADIKLPARLPIYPIKQEKLDVVKVKKAKSKKSKKEKKKKSKKKKETSGEEQTDSSETADSSVERKLKKKRSDDGSKLSELVKPKQHKSRSRSPQAVRDKRKNDVSSNNKPYSHQNYYRSKYDNRQEDYRKPRSRSKNRDDFYKRGHKVSPSPRRYK